VRSFKPCLYSKKGGEGGGERKIKEEKKLCSILTGRERKGKRKNVLGCSVEFDCTHLFFSLNLIPERKSEGKKRAKLNASSNLEHLLCYLTVGGEEKKRGRRERDATLCYLKDSSCEEEKKEKRGKRGGGGRSWCCGGKPFL